MTSLTLSLPMTSPTHRIVLSAMTAKTRRRVDTTINPVLHEIIPSVWRGPFGRIEILETRFEFSFVGMAIGAISRPMTGSTHQVILRGVEAVVSDKSTTMVENGNRF
jgi:hypothetical protein